MQNISGQQIDYDAFKKEFDNNPALNALVDRFDSEGIVLKTKTKSSKTPNKANKGEKDISGSAKRAAANILKK
jgi:hypothetical protein